MRLLYVLLIISILAVAHTASAEGGCPPGQYPQQGHGWRACVPAGNAAASQGPSDNFVGPTSIPAWVSLSTDADKGVLGESNNSHTEGDAKRSALSDCTKKGGVNCRTVVTVLNGCIAMAVSSDIYATGGGPTEGKAKASAVADCKKGKDPDCEIIYSKCVRPTY